MEEVIENYANFVEIGPSLPHFLDSDIIITSDTDKSDTKLFPLTTPLS